MPAAEIDRQALASLRLLPDDPDQALRLLAQAREQAVALGDARCLLRLRIVEMNHQARFGDREALGPQMVAASTQAREEGWMVEALLVDLLEIFLCTLGTEHEEGMRGIEAIRAEAEAWLEPIELSWMELMAGHFRGYLGGWAQGFERTYRALNRLIANADAPAGLVANTQKNIGYSHLLVGNLDLAAVHLEEAWRQYQPLPLTPRKLSAVKTWAQCLMARGELQRADAVMQPVLAARAELATPLYLASALLVAAEVKLALGDRATAALLLDEAARVADDDAEPAIQVHLAYVRALLLSEQHDVAAAVRAGEAACALIEANANELAVQSCLDLTARLQARLGQFERAYRLQCQVMDMRRELAKKSAEVRHIDLYVDHQTHVARMQADYARRERSQAEAAEAAIAQKNLQLEQRLREVERLQESLRELADRDGLTGLFNRRYLGEALPGLVSMVARRGERIALVLIDLDHFKSINDRHGHQMGDMVLAGFGDLLRDGFRAHDLCCRYGGEEFCIVMAGTDENTARDRLDELQERLGERVFTDGQRLLTRVGFSAGVVSFAADTKLDLDRVFRRADEALYAAKNGGRRRVATLGLGDPA